MSNDEPSPLPDSYYQLRAALGGLTPAVLLATSGGGDSAGAAVILQQWLRAGHLRDLRLCCVNHRLHPDAAQWCQQAGKQAERLALSCHTLAIEQSLSALKGSVEANARNARYQILDQQLARLTEQTGYPWVLVTAHHQQDQAETVLLHALRGSGSRGLRGMLPLRPSAQGGLYWRPFLEMPEQQLKARAQMPVVTDPSNADVRLRRNWLRHEMLPRLQTHWPDASTRLALTAKRAAQEQQLLTELAWMDAGLADRSGNAETGDDWPNPISWGGQQQALTLLRQVNLLRCFLGSWGVQPPPPTRLEQFCQQTVQARADRLPTLCWQNVCLRYYQQQIYLTWPLPEIPQQALDWPPGRASVRFGQWDFYCAQQPPRLANNTSPAPLVLYPPNHTAWCLRGLRASDRWPLGSNGGHKPLRQFLAEQKVPPWWRDHLPVLAAEDEVLAVWGNDRAWVNPHYRHSERHEKNRPVWVWREMV